MSDKALKPCPFCGGMAAGPEKFGVCDERNGYNFTMAIKCYDCGASVSRKSREDKGGWCNDTGQAKSEAIAAWNRRAPDVPEGWREFVSEVAQQTPEKPDYWNSCGQCERNADKAQDLIAASPQPPKDTESKWNQGGN